MSCIDPNRVCEFPEYNALTSTQLYRLNQETAFVRMPRLRNIASPVYWQCSVCNGIPNLVTRTRSWLFTVKSISKPQSCCVCTLQDRIQPRRKTQMCYSLPIWSVSVIGLRKSVAYNKRILHPIHNCVLCSHYINWFELLTPCIDTSNNVRNMRTENLKHKRTVGVWKATELSNEMRHVARPNWCSFEHAFLDICFDGSVISEKSHGEGLWNLLLSFRLAEWYCFCAVSLLYLYSLISLLS